MAIGLEGVVTTTNAEHIGKLDLTQATNLKVILPYAFWKCEKLNGTIESNKIEKVGTSAFYGCTGITGVRLDECIQVGEEAFENCTGLQELCFYSLETVEYAAFRGCKRLDSLKYNYFPMIRTIKVGAFSDCTGLINVSLPVLEISLCAFDCCTGLERVDLPKTERIEQYVFNNCSVLKEVKWNFAGNYFFALSNVPDNCQIYYVDGNGNTVDQYSFYDQYKQWLKAEDYDVPY